MEMVKRVARAIEQVALAHSKDLEKGPHVLTEIMAAAAIGEMLTPTEAMRIAALNTGLPGIGEPPLYEKIWLAMIDAAIALPAEGKEG